MDPFKHAGDRPRQLHVAGVFISKEIFGRVEPKALKLGGIIGLGMVHHHRGRRVEALDQQAGLIVDGKTERSGHAVHAALLQPVGSSGGESVEEFGVVLALEEAEMARQIAIALLVQFTDLSRDTPDRPATARGRPHGDFGVLEVRIFFA